MKVLIVSDDRALLRDEERGTGRGPGLPEGEGAPALAVGARGPGRDSR